MFKPIRENDLAQSMSAKKGWNEMQVFAQSISTIQKQIDGGKYKIACNQQSIH